MFYQLNLSLYICQRSYQGQFQILIHQTNFNQTYTVLIYNQTYQV